MTLKISGLATRCSCAVLLVLAIAPAVRAQGTLADYQRAQGLQAKARGLVVNTPGPITWIGKSDHFWYPRSMKGGTEFVLVDAAGGTKKLAFDHEKLAAGISVATGHTYRGLALPFAPGFDGRGGGGRGNAGGPPMTAPLVFLDDEKSIRFGVGGFLYQCALTEYNCRNEGPIPQITTGGRGGAPEDESLISPEGPGGDPVDGLDYEAGLEYQPPPQQDGPGGLLDPERGQRPCAPRAQNRTQARGGRGERGGVGALFPGQLPPETPDSCASFDGKWEAFIQNFNVFLKQTGSKEPAVALSTDGSEGNYYTLRSIAWSPDSKKLAAYHTRPATIAKYTTSNHRRPIRFSLNSMRSLIASPAMRSTSLIPRSSISRLKKKSRSIARCFRILTTSPSPCGGRTAADLPSNTISVVIRCIA